MTVEKARKRITFDPTINLGHILTFIGFMATAGLGYTNLDKRQTVTEVNNIAADIRVHEQEERVKTALADIKSDVKEVKQSVASLVQASIAQTQRR